MAKYGGIRWLMDPIKLFVLNLSGDAWRRGQMKANKAGGENKKYFSYSFAQLKFATTAL